MTTTDELVDSIHADCSLNCPHTVGNDDTWLKEAIENLITAAQTELLDELEPMTHEGRGTIAWEMDAIADWIKSKRATLKGDK